MEIKPTMMKSRFIILVAVFAAALSILANAESKQPDTYAFTRGVEAYNEDKYAEALDWSNRELSTSYSQVSPANDRLPFSADGIYSRRNL